MARYLSDAVPVAEGCIVLGRVWAGVKVALVQRRLGTSHELDRYGPDTARAVERFQRKRGLPVSGRVDARTWHRLGMERDFCMDRFTVQPQVEPDAGARGRIDAMIAWARDQVGRRYIWGGAGPTGYDCSGLALQAMYAGGGSCRPSRPSCTNGRTSAPPPPSTSQGSAASRSPSASAVTWSSTVRWAR